MVFPLIAAAAVGGAGVWVATQADDAVERFGITADPASPHSRGPLDTLNTTLGWVAIIGVSYLGYSLFRRL